MAYFFIEGKRLLYLINGFFYHRPVVDMDVAEEGVVAFMVVGNLILVPTFQVFHHFGTYLLLYLLGYKVTTFVYVDNVVQ